MRVTEAPAPSRDSLAFSRGLLGDLLEDSLGSGLDEVLGLLQAEAREGADLLDDVDLLLAGGLEDDVELVLLGGLLARRRRRRPAGAAATATGAAAVTPKVSSNCFTNSLSSRRVISLKASSSSSVLSFAMVAFLSVWCRGSGSRRHGRGVRPGCSRAGLGGLLRPRAASSRGASSAAASSAGASVARSVVGAASSAEPRWRPRPGLPARRHRP